MAIPSRTFERGRSTALDHRSGRRCTRENFRHLALALLDRLRRLEGDSRYPSPRSDGLISVRALLRAVDRNIEALWVAAFTPHDLRRTAASHMAGLKLGCSPSLISKLFNHVEPGITAIYDRHSYDQEKREVPGRWASALSSITGAQPSV